MTSLKVTSKFIFASPMVSAYVRLSLYTSLSFCLPIQ